MALRLRNRFRLGVARALVVLLAGASLGPFVHEGAGHDPDCEPVVVLHNSEQHRFGAMPSGSEALPHGDHCIVCHLFRSPRSSDSSSAVVNRSLEPSIVARTDGSALPPAGATLPLPARAPPARS